MKKIESPKMTSKVLYELLTRSYEQFKYFLQTWNLTISKTTKVNNRKSEHHKKKISSTKRFENVTSENDLKTPLEALSTVLSVLTMFLRANGLGHIGSLFSLRRPVITLNQREQKARVVIELSFFLKK